MIESHQRAETGGIFRFSVDSTTEMMAVEATDCCQAHPPLVLTKGSKRKSFAMSESPPPLPPPTEAAPTPLLPVGAQPMVTSATLCEGGGGGCGGETHKRKDRNASSNINRLERSNINDIQVSCCVGETMRIPLSGKTVPFRVVKRKGRGFSSVVFECQRENEEQAGADGPTVVTVKVRRGYCKGGIQTWTMFQGHLYIYLRAHGSGHGNHRRPSGSRLL